MNIQKRRVWRDEEIKTLLKSWKDHIHMKRLIKKRFDRNPLYFNISKDLLKDGYNRSMLEVMFKLQNLIRYHRRTKLYGKVNGPFISKYFNQVDEILKLEKSIHGGQEVSESETNQTIKLTYEPYLKESAPGPNKALLVRTNVTHDERDSETDLLSYTIIEPAESEMPNNSQVIQVSVPQLSSCNFQNTTDNILLKFCREFQRSNRQLEANDTAILDLFKQQNEIFRTQTSLLMQLLLK